jgi:hypothetical protein
VLHLLVVEIAICYDIATEFDYVLTSVALAGSTGCSRVHCLPLENGKHLCNATCDFNCCGNVCDVRVGLDAFRLLWAEEGKLQHVVVVVVFFLTLGT